MNYGIMPFIYSSNYCMNNKRIFKCFKESKTFNSLENNEFTNNNRSNNYNLEKNNNNNYQYINHSYYNGGQYLISNFGIMLCKQFVC